MASRARWYRRPSQPHARRARARGRARRRARPSARTPVLAVERVHAQRALGAVGLEVGAADDAVAPEERQHVVAVPALGLRLVDLDQVVEAEHAARERRGPRAGCRTGRAARPPTARPARASVPAGTSTGGAAVVDLEPLEQPVRDERVERAGGCRATPPLSRQCSITPASVSAPRARTARTASARSRSASLGIGCVQHLVRDHALRQVVEALEPLHGPRSRVAAVPEPVEHRLGRLPVPHPAAALDPRSGASRAGRARGSRPGSRSASCGCALVTVPVPVVDRGARASAVANSGQSSTGSRQASWAQYSNSAPSPSRREHRRPRIGADPGGEHDPVAALDGRDRVELDAREAPDRRLDRRGRCRGATALA